MTHGPEASCEPAHPALVVLYGNTARKHRPLKRDLLIIGRDRCCDLALVAPEVAAVHCILSCGSSGWRVRDCGSRAGTHVNGKPIQDAPLYDGDVLQIGPFSFRAHLPPQPAAPAAGAEGELLRLGRSRKKLAHLALGLRRRLNRALTAGAELAHQSEALRQRQRECEQRIRRLEVAERELAADREALERERALFPTGAERHPPEVTGAAVGTAEALLDHRRQELQHYADHLRRLRQELEEERAALAVAQAAFALEQKAAEARLAEGRAELSRMMAELRQLHQVVRERGRAVQCSQGEIIV